MRLIIAAFMLTALSFSAHANTIEVDSGDASEGLPLWSTVCVGNLELENAIGLQFRYGEEAEWQDFAIDPNYMGIFRYRFSDGSRPTAVSIRFDADLTDDAIDMKEYILEGNITRLRPLGCNSAVKYGFQMSPARDNTIDLFPL